MLSTKTLISPETLGNPLKMMMKTQASLQFKDEYERDVYMRVAF
jgi:hypothetical protein